MASFRYKAVGTDGRTAGGVIDAPDRRNALDLLSSRGLFPSSLEADESSNATTASVTPPTVSARPTASTRRATETAESPPKRAVAPSTPRKVGEHGRVSRKEISGFTRQMSTLLAATIPIPRALDGLAEQESSEALASVIQTLSSDVKRGEPFSRSLTQYPKLFSTLYSSMVQVGEESGQLDSVLEELADFLEDQDEMRGEMMSAIAYPSFVLGLGVLTTVVLLTFVMPRLLGIMTDLTDALPLPTRILLGVSQYCSQWWHVTLVGLVIAGVAGYRWAITDHGSLLIDRWRLSWPIFGRLFKAAALARFARTLGTLHRAGVSLLRALEIVRNTVGNRYVADRIDDIAEDTKGGDSLAVPIKRLGLFPPTMIQMISVGEETGRLDDMLLKVATIQEKEMRAQSRALISLLGPVLIVAVGALVGFIVIALLLPIFQISQGMS